MAETELVVLDTSALLAFLMAEPGGELVGPRLRRACLSAVSYAEAVSKVVDFGRRPEEAAADIDRLRLTVVPFDAAQAVAAAALRPDTRPHGLSLGDRCCLALAITRRLPVLTADRVWRHLSLDVAVELIR